MPKDYQISQYDEPICVDGYLDVTVPADPDAGRDEPVTVRVEIERVHMEEDTGKSLPVGGCHRPHPPAGFLLAGRLQPRGIPLVEIVTRPLPARVRAPRSRRATSPSCATCCAR